MMNFTFLLPLLAAAQGAPTPSKPAPVPLPKTYPSPGEIVAAAPATDWVAIAPFDLLVMDLAVDAKSKQRRVVIQLMPAPFSQGWVGNIRKLAAAKFWDGTAIVRVQDNYVTQWGDPDGETPNKAKKLPEGLATMSERSYETKFYNCTSGPGCPGNEPKLSGSKFYLLPRYQDSYQLASAFMKGWPLSLDLSNHRIHYSFAPVHCYGLVGVGRNMSPDTGTGAELYTVIGHAPRHLDRNIALVGRVIEGMEHLSSLPRGTEALGFYKTPEERTPILSIRLGNEVVGLPTYQYLSTESKSFARYADARSNRRDPFFIRPAGGADICNIPVPVRRKPA